MGQITVTPLKMQECSSCAQINTVVSFWLTKDTGLHNRETILKIVAFLAIHIETNGCFYMNKHLIKASYPLFLWFLLLYGHYDGN